MDEPPELAPALIERTGPATGRRHTLSLGSHLIGRGEGVTIELDDRDVSRRHARLDVAADRVMVEDLESKNGVFFAGHRIHGPLRIGHGDRFEIGEISLELDHAGARVGKVLAAGGETTMTRTAAAPATPTPAPAGLLLPVLGIVVFGGIVLALLLLG